MSADRKHTRSGLIFVAVCCAIGVAIVLFMKWPTAPDPPAADNAQVELSSANQQGAATPELVGNAAEVPDENLDGVDIDATDAGAGPTANDGLNDAINSTCDGEWAADGEPGFRIMVASKGTNPTARVSSGRVPPETIVLEQVADTSVGFTLGTNGFELANCGRVVAKLTVVAGENEGSLINLYRQ